MTAFSATGPSRAARLVLLALGILGGASCAEPVGVEIDSPEHGSFSPEPSVTISGRVLGAPNGTELLVNGVPVLVAPNGDWSHELVLDPAIILNPVTARLRSLKSGRTWVDRIVVIAGESHPFPAGQPDPENIAMRLRDVGLDDLEPLITDLLEIEFAEIVQPGELLIDNYCYQSSFLGCLGRVDVRVKSAPAPHIGALALAADSLGTGVAVALDFDDVFLALQIDSVTGFPIHCGLEVRTDTATAADAYDLAPSLIDPAFVSAHQSGTADVSLTNYQRTTDCSSTLLPAAVIDFFFALATSASFIESGLEDHLNDVDDELGGPVIGLAVEEALRGISIAGPAGTALGVDLDAEFSAIDEDGDGISMVVRSAFRTALGNGPGQCTPPAGAPVLPSTHFMDEQLPAHGPTTSVLGLPYDLAISIGTSAFNQLLRAQTECGLMLTSVAEIVLFPPNPVPLTSTVLGLFDPGFLSLPHGTPLRIDLRPTLGPVVTLEPGPGGEIAELRISHVSLEVVVDDGSETIVLEAAADATLGMNAVFDESSGALTLGITPPPVVLPVPADYPITAVIVFDGLGVNVSNLESQIIPSLMALTLPALGSELGSFPMPRFQGVQLRGVEVSREADFLDLYLDAE